MAITFDPANKRIILDVSSITATEIYSRWCDWIALSDNIKYLPAFSAVGGNDLGGSLAIPPYYFLTNGWRVRPMESNHLLVITGNLFVDGGGQPVVQTLGSFNVSVQYTVPVQAQAFVPTGGGSGSSLQPPLYTQGIDYSRPQGTVVSDAGNTPLSFKTSLTESSADFWKDALILFVSGSLKHQTKRVSSFNPSTDFLTISSPFTSAPGTGDQFVLITF